MAEVAQGSAWGAWEDSVISSRCSIKYRSASMRSRRTSTLPVSCSEMVCCVVWSSSASCVCVRPSCLRSARRSVVGKSEIGRPSRLSRPPPSFVQFDMRPGHPLTFPLENLLHMRKMNGSQFGASHTRPQHSIELLPSINRRHRHVSRSETRGTAAIRLDTGVLSPGPAFLASDAWNIVYADKHVKHNNRQERYFLRVAA